MLKAMLIKRLCAFLLHRESFFTCTSLYRSEGERMRRKEVSMYAKTIKRIKGASKRITWHAPGIIQLSGEPVQSYKPSEGSIRRAKQLSVIFYQYIISMVNSGELDPEIASGAVDITTVEIPPDFNSINVIWQTKGDGTDENMEALLQRNEKRLRQLLIDLHLIGIVPRVRFVRDNSKAKVQLVYELLNKADVGDRSERSEMETQAVAAPKPIVNAVSNHEAMDEAVPMRTNVYGLDYRALMEKVKLLKSKTNKIKRMPNGAADVTNPDTE